MGWEACNKFLFNSQQVLPLDGKICTIFAGRVYYSLRRRHLYEYVPCWLAGEVSECRSSGLQPREMLFTMQSWSSEARPSNPSVSLACFAVAPAPPPLQTLATLHFILVINWGHHFDHYASKGSLGKQATFYISCTILNGLGNITCI